MPLNTGCSLKAFRDNISKLIEEGRSRAQAVAIAVSTLRQSCKSRNKPMPDIGEDTPVTEDNSPAEKNDDEAEGVWGMVGIRYDQPK